MLKKIVGDKTLKNKKLILKSEEKKGNLKLIMS